MSFGQRLKQARKEAKKTQDQVAKILGLDYSTISKYENNHSQPDNETLTKLADYFGVSVDYLLGRTTDFFVKERDNHYIVEVKNPSPTDNKEKGLSEFENLFFYELDKLSEEDKQKALEHVRYLRYLAEQGNNK
ncbi:transcriptional regulator [Brevibacillus formosus]|uniref:Transcriptional regulator n=1 Tax=Brevibacillus formosus TaxID=54913 RepID=A0A220MHD6_9BACL|nr:helix-turn-helix transcriptional regulator [Brevibacillus formosus]ASJ54447.1 transcriptional regulator [Brevibacillus formosus]